MSRAGLNEGRRMRQSLRGLLGTHPYFGALALQLPIIADPKRENIGTDGKALYFSPSWVENNTSDEIKARIADCVLGCALKHHTRRGDRDYGRWQRAHAAVTLPLLRDAGLTDQRDPLEFPDKSIEHAYDLIPVSEDDGDGDGVGPAAAAAAAAAAAGSGKGQGDGQQDGDGDNQGEGQGQGKGQGNGQGQQPPSYAAPGVGEMMDSPTPENPTEAEKQKQQEEQRWDQAGKQAMVMAKAEGRAPGSIAELIDAAHQGKAPWRDILRRFMLAAAKRDYTWSRPQRRLIHQGLYLPSLHSEGMGHLVFAIDTSESLDCEALSQLWGELRSAVEEVDPEAITVLQCDTRVTDEARYDRFEIPLEIEAKGRGGTDFAPVMQAVRDLPEPPAVLVYQTDGFCSSFGEDPGCEVIWLIEPNGMADFEPPFGEVIRLEN